MKKKMTTVEKAKVILKINAILEDLRKNPTKQILLLKILEKYDFIDIAELLIDLKDYYM
jgi:hypothetical protein